MGRAAPLRVVVLGGGACGLTAAWRLSDGGAEVTVLEREPRVGGLCGTLQEGGFRFDLGGHRFITRHRHLDALVQRLLGEELLLRTRSSVILNGGQTYRYPLELPDVLQRFGLQRGVRALASFVAERARRGVWPRADRSFEDWVVHRFGRDLYQTFFGPYTEKLWGLRPDAISADWASQRISLLSLSDVLLRLLGLRHGGARTYARRYRYPRLGIGQIFERMAEELAQTGGRLQLGATVRKVLLDRQGRRVRAVAWSDAGGDHELSCDAVISTVSLPTLVRMTRAAPLSPGLERSCRALRFRAIRLLNLRLSGPPVSPHTWMYVSDPRLLPTRIQEPRHRSPEMAPAGCTSLMLEIPCEVNDPVWRASDLQIYERCLSDLASLGLSGLRARTLGYFSSFVPEGYPIYHLDYRADRGRLYEAIAPVERLITCGRQGGFCYIFMDAAMQMGITVAEQLLGGHRGGAALSTEGGDLAEAHALTA